MEKLRATIEQYARWKELGQYVDRMEGHLESDFSISIENAKALLESIGKEICRAKSVDIATSASINGVLTSAFLALEYSNENVVNQVSRSLANIAGLIGTLRNEISPTSHGKSLNELRDRNNKVDALTRGFLIDSTVVVAVFLIRAFEERKDAVKLEVGDIAVEESLPTYDKADDFNAFWDDAYGVFVMGEYSYAASEILFNVDYKAFVAEYTTFAEGEPEVEPGGKQ